MDYLTRGMGNPSLPWLLLTADTSTMVSTELAIEEYMAVGNPEQPTCRAAKEKITSPQMEKLVQALVFKLEVM